MESRNAAFNQGTVSGSPTLTQKALVSQATAGGMYPGQNGMSEDTYNARSPFISQALKGGY